MGAIEDSITRCGYALRYESLHNAGRCLAFPCDERGGIDLDALPEPARNNYFAARALVGRDFAHPVVEQIYVLRP